MIKIENAKYKFNKTLEILKMGQFKGGTGTVSLW
jgi:hypothetical protein